MKDRRGKRKGTHPASCLVYEVGYNIILFKRVLCVEESSSSFSYDSLSAIFVCVFVEKRFSSGREGERERERELLLFGVIQRYVYSFILIAILVLGTEDALCRRRLFSLMFHRSFCIP